MEGHYIQTKAKYKQLTTFLLRENAILVNANTRRVCIDHLVFKRDKSVVPFIPSSPKSNFMAITPVNLFTKEDPILRYIPTVRTAHPSSITWFEGTVFGSKAFDRDDMTDLMFLRIFEKQGFEEKALSFIRSKFGRNREDFLRVKDRGAKLSISKLFCSVCLVFGCGIHSSHNPRTVKYSEVDGCICSAKPRKSTQHHQLSFNEVLQDPLIKKLALKACIVSKILSLRYSLGVPCTALRRPNVPRTKTIALSENLTDPKQFYQPCEHSGRCLGNKCCCSANGTPCESFCQCSSCSNVVFCDCRKCERDCICRLSNRECTDLCTCPAGKGKEGCKNMPVAQHITRKASICKSPKHGLGLFAEEFIPADSFVVEYTGELITDKEAERRGNFYEMNTLSYLFNAVFQNSECLYSIDAFFIGNKSRFINHSVSNANLKSKILVSHGNVKIVFCSIRDIYKGEEFLFDYQFTDAQKKKHGITD